MQEYADPVIDWLDAGRGILGHRFFRDVSAWFYMYERPTLILGKVVYTTTQWVLYQGPVYR